MTEGKADLHIHSDRGDGILSVEEILDEAQRLNLTAIAITDHDQVAPSLAGRELAVRRGLGLEVVTGTELTIKRFRHLLALNIEEDIPFGLPLLTAIARIHRQGGLAIAAHPLVPLWPGSLREKEILSVVMCPNREVYFDGFEVLNGSVKTGRAREFHKKYLLGRSAPVAGSDAHFRTIGKAMTIYPLEIGILDAIKTKRTSVLDGHRVEKKSAADILHNFHRAMFIEPKRRGKWLA